MAKDRGVSLCDGCNQPVVPTDRFCRNCGKELPRRQASRPALQSFLQYLQRCRGVAPGATEDRPSQAVRFDDVAGMGGLKQSLKEIALVVQGRGPKGLRPWRAVMLFGPPGTGKTLIARALAGELDWHFFPLAGSDFKGPYHGESEQKIHNAFEEARKNAPSVIFLDEVENVARKREGRVGDSDLAQLLQEIEGFGDSPRPVLLFSATNLPWQLDDAFTSRMERRILVPLPDAAARCEILRLHTRDFLLADDVDLARLAAGCEWRSGRELERICQDAALTAWRRSDYDVQRVEAVTAGDFLQAIGRNPPLGTQDLLKRHVEWAAQFGTDRPSSPSDASAAIPIAAARPAVSAASEPFRIRSAALTKLFEVSLAPAPLDTWGVVTAQGNILDDFRPLRTMGRQLPEAHAALAAAMFVLGPQMDEACSLPEPQRLPGGFPPELASLKAQLSMVILPIAMFPSTDRSELSALRDGQWYGSPEGRLYCLRDAPCDGENWRQRLREHQSLLERALEMIQDREVREYLRAVLNNLRLILPQIPDGPLGPLLCVAMLEQRGAAVPLKLAEATAGFAGVPAHGQSWRPETMAGLSAAARTCRAVLAAAERMLGKAPNLLTGRPADVPLPAADRSPAPALGRESLGDRIQKIESRLEQRLGRLGGLTESQPAAPAGRHLPSPSHPARSEPRGPSGIGPPSRPSTPAATGSRSAPPGGMSLVSQAEWQALLSPQYWDIQQAAHFVFNSAHIGDNPAYRERIGKVQFEFAQGDMTVNAYATDQTIQLPSGKTLEGPAILVLDGLAHAFCLGSAALAAHIVGRAASGTARPSLDLPGVFSAMGAQISSSGGYFTYEASLGIFTGQIMQAMPDDKERFVAVAKSYAASMYMYVVAHEAGHIALSHTLGRRLNYDVSRNQERQADSFAACALSTCPFREYLFLGQVFATVVFAWVDWVIGPHEATTHPLAVERFRNALCSNTDAAGQAATEFGLTTDALVRLLPEPMQS